MRIEITKQQIDTPFTDIEGNKIGPANVKYTMKWGQFELNRFHYTPYGSSDIPPVWALGMTNISDLTFDNGDKIAASLEKKWIYETEGKTITIKK